MLATLVGQGPGSDWGEGSEVLWVWEEERDEREAEVGTIHLFTMGSQGKEYCKLHYHKEHLDTLHLLPVLMTQTFQ